MNRTRTATLLAVIGCSALTACGSNTPAPTPDRTTATATAASSPSTTSKTDLIAACADAIAAGKDQGDGAPECVDLPLDDYYDALQQANKAKQDAFNLDTDEARESATP